MRAAFFSALVCLLLVVISSSCREATSVVIEARTNVLYRPGFSTSFTVGRPGSTETGEPVAEVVQPWSGDGFVGSLVVVPESSDDATLAFKVVLGVRRDARACAPPNYEGCIVARRRIRYASHERLRVPVTLYAHCENVPCTADSTCNHLGVCVSDLIEAGSCDADSAEGCALADDRPNEAPSRVDVPSVDGGLEAGTGLDGSATGVDGGDDDGGGGLDASARDGGFRDGGSPGTVYCPPVGTCPLAASCCNSTTTTGRCVSGTEACGPTEGTFRCDGKDDCPIPGEVCCAFNQDVRCRDNTTCRMGGTELCESDGVCSGTRLCNGTLYAGIYGTCTGN